MAAANGDLLDRDGAFPSGEIAALHQHGLIHAPFSDAMGGHDLGSDDPRLLFDVLAALGQGSLPLGRLYEGHVNAVKLVRVYGSRENLALLKAEADVGRLTGVWMAEDGTPLELEGSSGAMTLSGRKILASGACHIQRPLIAARCEAGSQLLIPRVAEASRVDLSSWLATGMKASATGSVDFTGLAITPAEIVGRIGDYMRSPYFRGGAWRVMAVQFGGLQSLLESYRRQLVESQRDGDRVQRARFGEAAACVETARLWITEAGLRAESDESDPAMVDAYVDLMRGAFERAALTVVAHAEKSLGLKAFMRGNPVERIIRDLTTYLRQPALDASLEAAGAYFFHQPL
jgi:alkylation response protein AidB-like acyl-CoA dehydrogenase